MKDAATTKIPLKVGQIWKERSSRLRYVRIAILAGRDWVRIVTCDENGVKLGRRTTTASVWRFSGQHGGYTYIGEAKDGDGTEMVPNGPGGIAIQGLTRAIGQRHDLKVTDEIPARQAEEGRTREK